MPITTSGRYNSQLLDHNLKHFPPLTLYTLQILENHHLVYIHTRIITELYFSKPFSKSNEINTLYTFIRESLQS
jgi:hypothetical protein